MAIAVTHTFVATGSETAGAAAAGKVVTSEWNAAHTLAGFGTGVETWLATPSSANLLAAVTNETGTGALVFADTPTLISPVLGLATATAINKVQITPVATIATLTIADQKTIEFNNSIIFAGTDGTTMTFAGINGTVPILGLAQSWTAAQTNLQSIAAVSTDGWVLSNTTAAAAGAQQWSPRLHFIGQGWKTDSTTASQTVDWIAEVVPVQGAAAPTSELRFSRQTNAGGYVANVAFTSAGVMQMGAANGANRINFYTNAVVGSIQTDGSNFGLILSASAFSDVWVAGASLRLKSGDAFAWTGSSTTAVSGIDLQLTRSTTATLQQGAANAASPVAQTLQAQGSRSGTDSNVAGASYTFRPGAGTGNATPGALILQSYVAVASGTGAQTATDTITLNSGNATLGGMLITKGYAIGSLPTGVTGAVVHVTDQITAPAAKGIAPTAGGAIKCLVMFDGTNWVGV